MEPLKEARWDVKMEAKCGSKWEEKRGIKMEAIIGAIVDSK